MKENNEKMTGLFWESVLLSIAAVVFIFLLVFVLDSHASTATVTERKPTEYVLRAEIVDVEEETNLVLCEDMGGEVWSFYQNNDDWTIGDLVLLLMDTCETDPLTDDKVVSVRLDPFSY